LSSIVVEGRQQAFATYERITYVRSPPLAARTTLRSELTISLLRVRRSAKLADEFVMSFSNGSHVIDAFLDEGSRADVMPKCHWPHG